MRVLVVDDERIARERLVRMLRRIEGVEVAGQAADAEEALALISSAHPDLVLLDIRMPGLSGIEFAQRTPELPPIVFVTAHEEHALAAFDAAAVDYLLKPVEQDRLARAIERVRRIARPSRGDEIERLLRRVAGQDVPQRLSARRGDVVHLFDPRELCRVRAAGDYCAFLHEGREYLVDESLAALEERLAAHGFLRVHRAELVNLHRVRAIRRQDDGAVIELQSGETATVSRRFMPLVREKLGLPGR